MIDQLPQNLPTAPAGGGMTPSQAPKPAMPAIPTPPTPPAPKAFGAEPEDILGDVDMTQAQVKGPSQAPSLTVPPAMAPSAKPETKEPIVKQYRKIFVAAGLIIVIGGVAAVAGRYGYKMFLKPAAIDQGTSATNQSAANLNQNINTNQEASNINTETNANVNADLSNQAVQPMDSDLDGLTDEEEALYGTSPIQVDSDNDGLTDRDETKVFETDPNNSDTDGDSYLDGAEVRVGYDPKGPGRLLEIQQ